MLFPSRAQPERTIPPRSPLWAGVTLLAWSVLASLPPPANAQPAAHPKRVLVLYWYNMDFRPNVIFQNAFRPVLESAGAGAVEYYTEFLETNRFPEEQNALALLDYLRRK